MKYGINNLWPTPVYLGRMSDLELNDQMATEILISNSILGTTDTENIFDTDNEVINNFKNRIVIPAFEEYFKQVLNIDLKNYYDLEMKSWVTGNFSGYFMKLHNHHTSEFSAVFYVSNEDQTAGGEIAFIDPRSNANRGYELRIRDKLFADEVYRPQTGDFIIFPSFLYHHVLPYLGKLRIAVPVDIFLGPYKSSD